MKPFLYRPVNPFIINQHFGENKACVDDETGKNVISCDGNNPPAGYSSLYGPQGHTGLDLQSSHGQPVYCAADGVVAFIDTQARSGLDVRVDTVGPDGATYRHIYEHLMGYQPEVGNVIKCGDLIGWADNTGYSAGDHLHFQVNKRINGVWVPVDPEPLMVPTFAPFIKLLPAIKSVLGGILEWLTDMTRRPRA